ncbi:MAG: polyvinyl-alcohol dehydrogenase [Rhodospirillales bacterium]|nr:polyvinyl-alcohol dehydrogenase [Rhodospirillales bacterium]
MKLLTAIMLCLAFFVGRTSFAEPDGGKLFADRCSGCHDHARGRIPPRYMLNRMWPDQVVTALTTGPMKQQAAGLSQDDIKALVFFLTRMKAGAAEPDPKANLCARAAGPIDFKRPGWNGWGHDIENTRFQPEPGLAAQDVPRLKLKWAFAYPGSQTIGQPVVVGDRLFVTAVNGRMFSLDAKTGCTFWSFKMDTPVKAAVTIGRMKGDSSSRTAVYFGDMDGFVSAIDAADGRVLWKAKADPHPLAQVRGSPTLYQGRLYVPISSAEERASGDPGYSCCTFRGGLVALDAATGKIIWKSHTIVETPKKIGKNPAGTDIYGPAGGSVWNAPTIDVKRRRIYVGTGNSYSTQENAATDSVMAFDLDSGKRLWFTQATQHDTWVVCTTPGTGNCPLDIGPDFDFGSSTVLRTASNGKQVILAGQKSGAVYGFDPDDNGKIMWRVPLGVGGAFGGVEHGIAAEGDKVYVAISDVMATVAAAPEQLVPHKAGGISALNILTGAAIWHTAAPEPVCGWGKESCFAAQPAAVTAIPGVVFSGSLDGHIRAFGAADGTVVWDFDTGHGFDAVNGAKADGGAITGYGQIVAGGTLYLNSGGGYHGPPGNALLAFTVDGK